MTVFDDPNRQAVGLEPIWSAAGAAPAPGDEPAVEQFSFDPGEYTVAEVQDYLADNPDDYERVLAAERAGRNRATLTG